MSILARVRVRVRVHDGDRKWKSERTKRMDDDGNETRSRGYGSKRDQRTTFSKEVTQFGRGLDDSVPLVPTCFHSPCSSFLDTFLLRILHDLYHFTLRFYFSISRILKS